MARPSPTVLLQVEDGNNTWQVLEGEETYLITYQGKPVSIRLLTATLGEDRKKYKRMSYTEAGSAIGQVKRYNEMFNTTDFDYIRVFRNMKNNQN